MPVLPGNPPVEVHLRRSARARRFSLRVSRLDGKVTLTLPQRAREREALGFLMAQEDWLRTTLAGMPEAAGARVALGTTLPVEGVPLCLEPGPGRSVRVDGGRLLVPGDPAVAAVRVAAWLKTLARDRLATASTRYAGLVGRGYLQLTLRDTRSRWGSCSPDGRLMYSWRLILAPPSVLDYVAAHEVAHLVEMNHSPAYWQVVSDICPDWRRERAWLRAHGEDLHRLRFGD
ncbi:M48 family metallopeptidase [Rhodobacter sp. Har01]|uniref:M48 family metallopeptidase n=1 Tax=Rhodobacter sp. Har01 TaxID=2883999 RepID=UPI001D06ADF5|nr:SprT family zinc-dependent metalloprotease [Rhodobacter sp. Har01]MCB6178539.1 M48 family metallopeptidase [Rhodobacter sp. Har01]